MNDSDHICDFCDCLHLWETFTQIGQSFSLPFKAQWTVTWTEWELSFFLSSVWYRFQENKSLLNRKVRRYTLSEAGKSLWNMVGRNLVKSQLEKPSRECWYYPLMVALLGCGYSREQGPYFRYPYFHTPTKVEHLKPHSFLVCHLTYLQQQ